MLKEIFGVSRTIDEAEFTQKLEGYKFLESLEMIRNMIFERAKIERKHINEEEEKRHIERKNQQIAYQKKI